MNQFGFMPERLTMEAIFLIKQVRENGVFAPVQRFNCDFTPVFSTLWFYPCYFETKEPFAPGLNVCYLEAD